MKEDQEARDRSVYVRLMSTPGIGPRTMGRLYQELESRGLDQKGFDELGPNGWKNELGLPSRAIEALQSKSGGVQQTIEELERNGCRILTLHDPGYPDRLRCVLGDKAPAVVFVRGNLELCAKPSIAIAGSRDASSEGLDFAARLAAEAASRGCNVVSGHARGVDRSAHQAALKGGGTTSVVLAEGMLGFHLAEDLEGLLDEHNALVISEFAPRLPWSIHNAMARNGTICALADTIVLVEPRDQGGTFEAGRTTLQLGIPAWVESGPSKGGTNLIALGVKEISRGAPDWDAVFSSREKRQSSEAKSTRQGSLFEA